VWYNGGPGKDNNNNNNNNNNTSNGFLFLLCLRLLTICPGASSMYGILVELGPLWLNDLSTNSAKYNATGIPQLVRNPFAWSKIGSLLMVDSPPPVGFSYCTQFGPAGL
jgi:carboxypeptidase C (cathepsin A)